jgi:hypothetical protein
MQVDEILHKVYASISRVSIPNGKEKLKNLYFNDNTANGRQKPSFANKFRSSKDKKRLCNKPK